jgi:AcrR family transcriptional regulator
MVDFEKVSQKAREFRQREQDILQTALTLFLSHGEDKVTVEMIAEKVGIGKGTIYKHFETKNEIYLRLMIDYEEELAATLKNISDALDTQLLMREYFRFRMADPARYALFDRLEAKCVSDGSVPELLQSLHDIRAENMSTLTKVVRARIDAGILVDRPEYYHLCAAWALVHGAVALTQSDFFKQLIPEPERFFEFMMDVGARLGVKSKSADETMLVASE